MSIKKGGCMTIYDVVGIETDKKGYLYIVINCPDKEYKILVGQDVKVEITDNDVVEVVKG